MAAHFELAGRRVFVAGHRGLVGSALVRRLGREDCELLTVNRDALDLRDQAAVRQWFSVNRPDTVFLAAARVGGILANARFPADFLYDNLAIAANVIDAAFHCGVDKLLFLGSSCAYPKLAQQPISEEALLSGPLEPTNESYAVAKIVGIKLVQALRQQHDCDFISAMPCNIYGDRDSFDPTSSHVIPALIRKAYEAKQAGSDHMVIWGTGKPRREFLHADDVADACVFMMKRYSGELPLNIGAGRDLPIRDLANMIAKTIGFGGAIRHDTSKPDGTPRKLLNVERLFSLGWRPTILIEEGLRRAYLGFLDHDSANARARAIECEYFPG